jgi:predicted nucleic acid-binding protein
LIDANIIVSFLIQAEDTDRATEILRESLEPVITLNILEESIYIGLSLIYGSRGFRLREDIKKDMKDDARTYMSNLRTLIDKFKINIIHPPKNLEMISDIITKYRLMPNDAIIATTCQHYGIKCIATFDSDFKRVEFLEIVD